MNEMRDFVFINGERIPVGTMYCIGRNYAAHAREMNAPVPEAPLVFIKPPDAYVQNGSVLELPSYSQNVHHEVELVVVIGSDTNGCSAMDALSHVAGYAVGIDLTLRDVQARAKAGGEPWAVSKAFRGSAPVSAVIPREYIADPGLLELKLNVNGEKRQHGYVSSMERSVGELISYVSKVFGLRRGDCIFTGTPEGVTQIVCGDVLEAEIIDHVGLTIQVR